MATIQKFEDINAWKSARTLCAGVYDVSSKGGFSSDYALRDQIRRAAISVMSNIAEGFGRKSPKSFAQFLDYAHGSAAEVQSQLYIALDLKYISESEFIELHELSDETSRMIYGFKSYLEKKNSPLLTPNS